MIILAVVDEDGCIGDLKVHQSLNDYADQDDLWAARTWVFMPSLFKGKPVPTPYALSVNVVLTYSSVP